MGRVEIVGAGPADTEELFELSAHLNTVNLPRNRPHIERLLKHSEASFRGRVKPAHRKLVFLLKDLEAGHAVGTSTIVAQLGRRDAPYIYFDVTSEEKYSRSLDRHFFHTVLRIGFSYVGPTELGGLVVHPAHRGSRLKLGLLISFVRFLFIAMHPDLFRDQLLAELLPPLEPDGTSHLWEALGRRFTNMSYAEADLLSSTDKAFVRDLFPSGAIYATLLSPEAQAVIGKVGVQTRGVEKMLRRVGFRYAERIDPFDGGPHFIADRAEVGPIKQARSLTLETAPELSASAERALLGLDLDRAPHFRAIVAPVERSGNAVRMVAADAARLEAAPGQTLGVLPLPLQG